MTLRILADFNSMDKLGRVHLNFDGSQKDFDQGQLHVGDFVILYEPGEYELRAVLDFDTDVATSPHQRGRWVASPLWSTVIQYGE